jgi:hypothetical protein
VGDRDDTMREAEWRFYVCANEHRFAVAAMNLTVGRVIKCAVCGTTTVKEDEASGLLARLAAVEAERDEAERALAEFVSLAEEARGHYSTSSSRAR